jgi:hypothetical protein
MRKFMWVTDAERDMIKILRASDHVTLNISRDGGQWNMRLEDHDSGSSGFGSGPTFDRAWDAILDPRLRDFVRDIRNRRRGSG